MCTFQEVTTSWSVQSWKNSADVNFQMAPRLFHSDIRQDFPYRISEKIEPMTAQWLKICPTQTSGDPWICNNRVVTFDILFKSFIGFFKQLEQFLMTNNYNFGFLIILIWGVGGSSPSIVAFMCSNPDKTVSTILPCLEYFPSNLTHHFLKGRTQNNCKIGSKLQFQAKDDFRRMFSFTKAKRESN